MTAGDPIWYRLYGFEVPGVFVKRTERRVVVRLVLKSGEEKNVTVHPQYVRPRDPSAALWEAAP